MSRTEFTKAAQTLPVTDYLAWRVLNMRKHKSEISHNRAYSDRPRLRNDMHR